MHEVVAEILESFQCRSLSRPAHAGNDDEFRRGVGLAFTSASRFSRRARHLLKFAAQWHARNLSISEGVEAALWLRCGCRKDRRDLLQLQNRIQWALNSAVECHPHTVEVVGSNPTAPTICLFTAFGAPDSLSPSSFHGCFRHSRLSNYKRFTVKHFYACSVPSRNATFSPERVFHQCQQSGH